MRYLVLGTVFFVLVLTMQNCSAPLFVNGSSTAVANQSLGDKSPSDTDSNGTPYNGKLVFERRGACGVEAAIEVTVSGAGFPVAAHLVRDNCSDITPHALELGSEVEIASDLRTLAFASDAFILAAGEESKLAGLIVSCRRVFDAGYELESLDLLIRRDEAGHLAARVFIEKTVGGNASSSDLAVEVRGSDWVHDATSAGHYLYLTQTPTATGHAYNFTLPFSGTNIQSDGRAECYAP